MNKPVIHIFHVHVSAAIGQAGTLSALGFGLEYARDAFVRLALEGSTVISL